MDDIMKTPQVDALPGVNPLGLPDTKSHETDTRGQDHEPSVVTELYALYHGDCVDVLRKLPEAMVHLSVYSPPFGGLYQYSSDPRDLSNARTPSEFFEHYGYVIDEIFRVTMPGRMSAVHCIDIPTGNTGKDHLRDFPGEVIALHAARGFDYVARYHVWKEPLTIRNRTMTKSLAHQSLVEDSTRCSVASADYLLIFRRRGNNPVPVTHAQGLLSYAGERQMPPDAKSYEGWTGRQIENKFSHWIWRQYASAFWDDVRLDRVLPFKVARDADDERHVHALQLDVIDRALVLWSNPGETILTPFLGVGSEAYASVLAGRKAVGVELKATYFRQAVKNVMSAGQTQIHSDQERLPLFCGEEAS